MPLPHARSRDSGVAALEYVGLLVVVAALLVALGGFGPRLVSAVGCAVSTVTGSGGCSPAGPPTTYADGGTGGPVAAPTVDWDAVRTSVDTIDDALDGGFFGVRSGDLDDVFDTFNGLNGAEIDQVVGQMSDRQIRKLVDEMDDGWFGSGWSHERRREFWNLLAERASTDTLDRLARFTDEIQPRFDTVGGDAARGDQDSVANTSEYGDLPGPLFEQDGGDRSAADPHDVRQGQLGDCWFIASMMGVAQTHPELLERNIRENANGSFTVTLYDDGKPVPVTVLRDMVLRPDGSPAFVGDPRSGEQTELWPLVLEKAMALHAGDFEDIEGDTPARALDALTGVPTRSVGPGDLPAASDLHDFLSDGGVIALSSLSPGDSGDHPLYDRGADKGGLVAGHAYYVSDVDVDAGTVTVVNPWGIESYPPVTLTYDQLHDNFREFHLNQVVR